MRLSCVRRETGVDVVVIGAHVGVVVRRERDDARGCLRGGERARPRDTTRAGFVACVRMLKSMTWSKASSANGSSCTSPRQTVAFFTFASRVSRGVHHLLVAIDARDALRSRRQELRERPVARAGVEHVAELHETEEPARRRLPGAPRRVVALHLPGDRIGPRVRARRAP